MKQQSGKKSKTTCNQEVYSEVAKELGLPILVVKEVFAAHSAYTKQVMESNTFDGIRWPYLGVFRSKPKEVQVINHMKGLTPEQQKEFKQKIREGKYRLLRDEIAKRRERKRT